MAAEPKKPREPMTLESIRAQLHEKFLAYAEEQLDATDPKEFMDSIVKDLENQKRAVTLKLLGMDNRWGKWEVDHCNGRSSPITTHIAAAVEPLLTEWMEKVVVEELRKEMSKTTTGIKNAMRAEVLRLIEWKSSEYAKKLGEELLEKASDELKAELTKKE